MKTRFLAILAVAMIAAPSVNAAPVLVNFEGFADSTVLSNQIAALSIQNALVLTAGVSLNEFEFPPASGSNVVTNTGSNLIIDFTVPVYSVSGRITYNDSATLTAYDPVFAQVGNTNSLHIANFVSSGNSPNELIAVSWAGGISRVVFSTAAASSFVLDDLIFETAPAAVPEPATLGLLGLAFAGLGFVRRKRAA